jgi:hypothetical protein
MNTASASGLRQQSAGAASVLAISISVLDAIG